MKKTLTKTKKPKKKVKFIPVKQKSSRHFSEWQTPKMKGYLMKCCDCGLVHKLDFRVFVKSKIDGKRYGTVIEDKAFGVDYRAKRVTFTS
jgi:hypothetical protein